MDLHALMASLRDATAEATEAAFADNVDVIVWHLERSHPPATRALALDVAQTFVQSVLSERSKDKNSSKKRRRAFKYFLAHVVPLMLDCLENPAGDASASPLLDDEGSNENDGGGGEERQALEGDCNVDLRGGGGGSGQVAANHQQYLLKVAVLDSLRRFVTTLRVLFRPELSTRVHKAVAPLLDAPEGTLREKAATVLGKLAHCTRDASKWVSVAVKVSLESHSLLQQWWPGESDCRILSAGAYSIIGNHHLLPPIELMHSEDHEDGHVLAMGRRLSSLCKLLANLVTYSPQRPKEAEQQQQQRHEGGGGEGEREQTDGASSEEEARMVSLAMALASRMLGMGAQTSSVSEGDVKVHQPPNDPKIQAATSANNILLSPGQAERVSGLLLPSVLSLLEALIASERLEKAMVAQQAVVCRLVGQAVAQVPVQGGARFAAYRSVLVILRYTNSETAAVGLGVPILPLLVNEALLAVGNFTDLCPLHIARGALPQHRERGGQRNVSTAPPLLVDIRTPLNNGHGPKLHKETVWAGVECLAEFVLYCGLFLPSDLISEVERVVAEVVAALARRPLDVSPSNEEEPQVLRHASTREAIVRLVHYYLLLAAEMKRNPGSALFFEARRAFRRRLEDPDGAVATECRWVWPHRVGGACDGKSYKGLPKP